VTSLSIIGSSENKSYSKQIIFSDQKQKKITENHIMFQNSIPAVSTLMTGYDPSKHLQNWRSARN